MKLKNQQDHEDLKQQEQSIDLNKDSVQMENKENSISWAEKDMANQEDLSSLNEFDLELNKEDE